MRQYALPLLVGLLGMLLGLAGWHLWDDHRFVDAIRANIAAQQRAAPQAPTP